MVFLDKLAWQNSLRSLFDEQKGWKKIKQRHAIHQTYFTGVTWIEIYRLAYFIRVAHLTEH